MHAQPSFFLPTPQGITSSHLVIIRGESYHLPFLLIQGSGAELLPPCKPVEVSQCLFTCLRSQLLRQNPQYVCVYVCDTFNTNERHPFLKMSSVMQEAVQNTPHSKPPPILPDSEPRICQRQPGVTKTVWQPERQTTKWTQIELD